MSRPLILSFLLLLPLPLPFTQRPRRRQGWTHIRTLRHQHVAGDPQDIAHGKHLPPIFLSFPSASLPSLPQPQRLINPPFPPLSQTKEEISSADLVANLNLKRLIYDLVAEGGQGLAAKPTNAEEASQETAFGFDDVMVLRCLGPAESDWINRSQVVTKEGISGGRRRNSTGGKDSMVFQVR